MDLEDCDTKEYLTRISEKFSKSVKIVHINAQSLNDVDHFSEFNYLFVNSGIEIIAVSETWFNESSTPSIPGYKEYTVNRTEMKGGGVAIYLTNEFEGKILSTSNGKTSFPEFILMEVSGKTDKFLVACVYRPPKIGHIDVFFNEVLSSYITEYKYTIVCGDFNLCLESNLTETKRILNLLQEYNLEMLPFNKTYRLSSTCETTLDIVASNCRELLLEFGQTPAPGFSKHDLLYSVFNFSKPKKEPKVITYRDLRTFSKEAFMNDVCSVSWQCVYNASDIDEKVSMFNSIFLQLVNKHAPLKTFKTKCGTAPWMTPEITKLLSERDKARKKHLKTKSVEDGELFKSLRNKSKQNRL